MLPLWGSDPAVLTRPDEAGGASAYKGSVVPTGSRRVHPWEAQAFQVRARWRDWGHRTRASGDRGVMPRPERGFYGGEEV